MSTVRMLPLSGATVSAWTGSPDNVAGRTYYKATAGGFIDAPDVAASDLGSQGFVAVGGPLCPGSSSGATAVRPNAAAPGWLHVDTTLNATVMFDGANWRNPATGVIA